MQAGLKFLMAMAVITAWHMPAVASSRTPLGQTVEVQVVSKQGGGSVKVWNGTDLTVLLFFRPGQEHSQAVMRAVGELTKELTGRQLRWLGVASDRYAADAVTADVKSSEMQGPVAIDTEDKLASALGLALLPELAFVSKDGKLIKVMPCPKVNCRDVLRAEVRFALKEITDTELKAAVDPAALPAKAENSAARRHIKMAELMLNAGNIDKALESARVAVQQAPDLAVAHTVLGLCLSAKGDCKAATESFDNALKLDKNDGRAAAGKQACAEKAK